LAHLHIIFALFSQTYDLLQSLVAQDRVINKLSKNTLQKLSAKLSKGGSHGIFEKVGPEASALFASLNIHPWLYYIIFSVQEVTILLNLP